MKKLLAAITMLLLSSSAFATQKDKEFDKLFLNKEKHASKEECTKAAGKRKGNERKAFIEGCRWSNHTPRRDSCNEKAKAEGIHGATREQFMEKCRGKYLHKSR